MILRRIYKYVRDQLPEPLQARLTEMVFRFSTKPFVLKGDISTGKKFPNGELGGMILSSDFELAWAWRYAKKYQDSLAVALQMAQQARKNFPQLIDLFDNYSIPVTWATVGHLFLNHCNKEDHKWMARIPYFENRNWRYTEGDWYDHDPCSDYKSSPEWYAPDLIRMILGSKMNHEISTHTFSHIDFSDKNCPPEVAEDELKASIQAMAHWGLKPISIVFPGGTFGNVEMLKKYDFQIYRKNTEYDLAYPYTDKFGLLVSPTSQGFMRTHESWPASYYIKRFKEYINKAIKTGTIAHFWFHPSLDQWSLNNVMPSVLAYAAEQNKKGVLWIGTMKEISKHIGRK